MIGKRRCTWLSCGKDAEVLSDTLGKIMGDEITAFLKMY
jgi:hypothetical protein